LQQARATEAAAARGPRHPRGAARRAALLGMGRHHRGLRQRRDPAQGAGLSADAELQERRRGQGGAAALPDRSAPVQSVPRPGGRGPRERQGDPEEDRARRRALQATRQGGRGQPGRARQRRAAERGQQGRGLPGAGQRRAGEAQPRLDQGQLADRRHRGHQQRADRRPGRQHHRADHGVDGRPDQDHLPDRRAAVSALRQADQPRLGNRRDGPGRAEDRAGPGQRQRVPADGPLLCGQPSGRRAHRHAARPDALCEPGQRPATGRLRQGARGDRHREERAGHPAARGARSAGHFSGLRRAG